HAAEGEPVAEGREHLMTDGRILRFEDHAPGAERSLPSEVHAGDVVDDLRLFGEQGRERVGIAGGDRGLDAGCVRRRGVWLYAALKAWRGPGLGRELLEAGEGFVLASDVEHLPARHEAIGSEDEEVEVRSLVGTPAGAVRAEVSHAHEERTRVQAENVVNTDGDVVGELDEGAETLQHRVRSARGPGPQGTVVDGLDGGGGPGGKALDRGRSGEGRGRSRGRDGAGALGAFGKELGVALVQAYDGVAEMVRGEALVPPAPPLCVDLD